jgi:hypothetical protein
MDTSQEMEVSTMTIYIVVTTERGEVQAVNAYSTKDAALEEIRYRMTAHTLGDRDAKLYERTVS